ncbi:Phospho-2-dehydro-3-deoxyheptonate aldolase, Phe-sensitive [Lacunisphaera limnophila]|uniref:Phospho-2-dehydro-3-deoxyheptonate aldolase n=1 Tax=Lacunisphaera limnophila TaxID=1838286 RepID=A0A1D8AUI7_9BACT|nr:3-deoxy-7-phosphoheptulonate synthase [Lacunisphaera limnophila]AOS44561.1 Phospho-2-dehydro-3-deoxyheptonate aldolase, Phe-sensitive [Lacunisphaera limnophila]
MRQPISDLRIRTTRPLLSPAILEEDLPLSEAGAAAVHDARRAVSAILQGRDDRLVAIVGPCSIHDPAAALDYARKLKPVADRLSRDLLVVMRVYFEKPRTTVGWKGLINDPHLDGTFQVNAGLRLARQLMLDVNAAGLPIGTEFLDTTLGQYYADLVAWGAIGARTTESQIHRELASGLSMPVGFKNRTDGDLQVAVDAIVSARHAHCFPSLTREGAPAILATTGNPDCHLVLRGGTHSGPNFSAPHIRQAVDLLGKAEARPVVLVDCSHGNSGKKHDHQPAVAADVAAQVAGGSRAIMGVMLESALVGGAQKYVPGQPLVPGQSITDACLSFDATVPVLEQLAAAVATRRAK